MHGRNSERVFFFSSSNRCSCWSFYFSSFRCVCFFASSYRCRSCCTLALVCSYCFFNSSSFLLYSSSFSSYCCALSFYLRFSSVCRSLSLDLSSSLRAFFFVYSSSFCYCFLLFSSSYFYSSRLRFTSLYLFFYYSSSIFSNSCFSLNACFCPSVRFFSPVVIT